MVNFFDEFKETRTVTPIIFAIDASGSMTGERIQGVNTAINNLVEKFAFANKSSDSLIEYSILRFATEAQWLTDGFITPDNTYVPSITAHGLTDLGAALDEINNKLSQKGFLESEKVYGQPYICFITDGRPTDDYIKPLNSLKKNTWYKQAEKFAVIIGTDADCEVMGEVCCNVESVVQLKSVALLGNILLGLFSSLTKTSSITESRPDNNSYYSNSWGEFNSAPVCFSKSIEFDSDSVATSCCIGDNYECCCDPSNELDHLSWGESDCDTFQTHGDEEVESQQKLTESSKDETENVYDNILNLEKPVNSNFLTKHSFQDIQNSQGKPTSKAFVSCSSCGESMEAKYKFCPNCGTPTKTKSSEHISINQVQFSAVVPKKLTKGEYAMIDISVYEDAYRHVVDRIIANSDTEVKEVTTSSQDIAENTMVRIILHSPDIDVFDCDETQKWYGRFLTYSFPVEIPINYEKKQILFIASVYFNNVIATKLKFIINCTTTREQKIQLMREDVLTAFISYASQDRSRVATIIQGMKKARPDMDIFFDVESLRSGEYWEATLKSEIENRDVLFLCWSHFAKESKWVEVEWRHALTNKGLDSIEPIPLVSPAECPPPDELKSKHFNDKALLYKEN